MAKPSGHFFIASAMYIGHVGDHSITKCLENTYAALEARGADAPVNVHHRANRLEELSFTELPLVIDTIASIFIALQTFTGCPHTALLLQVG